MGRKAFFIGFTILFLTFSVQTHSYWICNCQSTRTENEVVTGKTKAQALAQCYPNVILANIDCYEYIPAPPTFSCGKLNEYVPREEDCCIGLQGIQVNRNQFFCQDNN